MHFVAGSIVLLFAFYIHAWRSDRPTVITPPDAAIVTPVDADLYALLARGFLRGQLSLAVDPPPELATAANPYDPRTRPPVLYLHDTSLYRGKYYLYFGPAPAALVFAPCRLLFRRDLPSPWAVWLFVSLAYVGSLIWFRALRRVYFPAAGRWTEPAGALILAGCGMFWPLVRRPGVYEVAISAGCAASLWGLYFAWRGGRPGASRWWSAGCGALLGIAVASRPTFGVWALPATLLLLAGAGRGGIRHYLSPAWPAAVVGSCALMAVLAFNAARFGNPFEFGQKYQLSATYEGNVVHFSTRFAPTQLWYYFWSPLHPSAHFPFFHVGELTTHPAGFGTHEFSYGIVTNAPAGWFALVALVWAIRRSAGRAEIAALLAAGALSGSLLVFYFFSCARYQAEFAPSLALLAAIGVLAVDSFAPEKTRLWRAIAGGSGTITLAVALLATVDMYNPAENAAPVLFDRVGAWLNQPTLWLEHWRGIRHGPVQIEFEGQRGPGRQLLLRSPSAHDPEKAESVSIEFLAADRANLVFERTGEGAIMISREVDWAEHKTHRVNVSLSSLYPPRAIEMLEQPSAEDLRTAKQWVTIDWNGRRVIEEKVPPVLWRRAPPASGPGVRLTFTATKLDSSLTRHAPGYRGVRLRVRFDDSSRGHAYPLAVTGQPGRGDFLFVEHTADGQLRFGYDHWGKPGIRTNRITVEKSDHEIEFWMPSVLQTIPARNLVVKLDATVVWSVPVPYYAPGPSEVFIARNPLGGSACERDLPGAIIDATDLPTP